jgi:23S rRNA (cytosine1962-C5)-methyltransferase
MYQLLDSGQGRKLEKFGDFVLDRPDPQILWQKSAPELWERADAVFDESWYKKNSQMPDEWQVEYLGLKLWVKLTPFKHTGIFPEQVDQWQFIKSQTARNVLNLFGYTGIASLIAAQTGANVTYVDASKQALTWARRNQDSSGLSTKPIRWILDDVLKFVGREHHCT